MEESEEDRVSGRVGLQWGAVAESLSSSAAIFSRYKGVRKKLFAGICLVSTRFANRGTNEN